jgi:hypothetical protein
LFYHYLLQASRLIFALAYLLLYLLRTSILLNNYNPSSFYPLNYLKR